MGLFCLCTLCRAHNKDEILKKKASSRSPPPTSQRDSLHQLEGDEAMNKIRLSITIPTEKSLEECAAPLGQVLSMLIAAGMTPTEYRILTGEDIEKSSTGREDRFMPSEVPPGWTMSKQSRAYKALIEWGKQEPRCMTNRAISKIVKASESEFSRFASVRVSVTKRVVERAVACLKLRDDVPSELLDMFEDMLLKPS